MKEQNKTPEKELNEMEITNLSDAEFKTLMFRDAQITHWVWQKHKKDTGRNEGYQVKLKKKSTGNQQWTGWCQDSNQQFGT